MSTDPPPIPPAVPLLAVLAPAGFGAVYISALYTDAQRANEHARNIDGMIVCLGTTTEPLPASSEN